MLLTFFMLLMQMSQLYSTLAANLKYFNVGYYILCNFLATD